MMLLHRFFGWDFWGHTIRVPLFFILIVACYPSIHSVTLNTQDERSSCDSAVWLSNRNNEKKRGFGAVLLPLQAAWYLFWYGPAAVRALYALHVLYGHVKSLIAIVRSLPGHLRALKKGAQIIGLIPSSLRQGYGGRALRTRQRGPPVAHLQESSRAVRFYRIHRALLR